MENNTINSFESSPIKGLSLNELDLAVQSTRDDDDKPHPAVQIQNDSNPIVQFQYDIPNVDKTNSKIQIEVFQKEMPGFVDKFVEFSKGIQVPGLLSASFL